MNEFIVWDEKRKSFNTLSDDTVLAQNGCLYEYCFTHENISPNAIPLFYIGKTDTEGNKIYAESSIVKFKVEICKSKVTRKGYFSFNSELGILEIKAYSVSTNAPDKERFNFVEFNIIDLKVIGTLQENKELLDEK